MGMQHKADNTPGIDERFEPPKPPAWLSKPRRDALREMLERAFTGALARLHAYRLEHFHPDLWPSHWNDKKTRARVAKQMPGKKPPCVLWLTYTRAMGTVAHEVLSPFFTELWDCLKTCVEKDHTDWSDEVAEQSLTYGILWKNRAGRWAADHVIEMLRPFVTPELDKKGSDLIEKVYSPYVDDAFDNAFQSKLRLTVNLNAPVGGKPGRPDEIAAPSDAESWKPPRDHVGAKQITMGTLGPKIPRSTLQVWENTDKRKQGLIVADDPKTGEHWYPRDWAEKRIKKHKRRAATT